MKIKVPANFIHAGQLENRYSVDPRAVDFQDDQLDIDLRECTFVRPAAVLWGTIYPLLTAFRGTRCRLLVPENLGVCVYLKSVGLFEILKESGIDVDDRDVHSHGGAQLILPLTRFSTENEVENLANQALESLGAAGVGAANLYPVVSEIFAELALNAA